MSTAADPRAFSECVATTRHMSAAALKRFRSPTNDRYGFFVELDAKLGGSTVAVWRGNLGRYAMRVARESMTRVDGLYAPDWPGIPTEGLYAKMRAVCDVANECVRHIPRTYGAAAAASGLAAALRGVKPDYGRLPPGCEAAFLYVPLRDLTWVQILWRCVLAFGSFFPTGAPAGVALDADDTDADLRMLETAVRCLIRHEQAAILELDKQLSKETEDEPK